MLPSGRYSNRISTILSYHKIGDPDNGEDSTWNYVPEEVFTGHLRHLEQNDWHVIDIQTFLRGLEEPQTLPFRAALITFDDGYRSTLTAALPILMKFGYPAVVFVPTDFIGGLNMFDEDIEPGEPICSWRELLELERHGVSVQSHGVSHRHFSNLSLQQQQLELSRSMRAIQERLQLAVVAFAYPYGDVGKDFNGTRTALVQTGYRAAFLYGGGVTALPVDDPYLLHRLAMGPDTDLSAQLAQVVETAGGRGGK